MAVALFAANNSFGRIIAGITQQMDYLERLGIEAIWLSPFYPSPLVDGGYDVADYCDVDPRLGSLDDFDDMVAAAHARGIKVIVDIVPNHSSNQHPWFKAALAAGPGSPERARYIFRDGRGEYGELPPTNWNANFGGPAWTRVADGQWYLHMFTPEQPDFDWSCPEVHAFFCDVLTFWSDRGVDGFRIDVAHGLAKDFDRDDLDRWHLAEGDDMVDDGTHPLRDRNEAHEIYRAWRRAMPCRKSRRRATTRLRSTGSYATGRLMTRTVNSASAARGRPFFLSWRFRARYTCIRVRSLAFLRWLMSS